MHIPRYSWTTPYHLEPMPKSSYVIICKFFSSNSIICKCLWLIENFSRKRSTWKCNKKRFICHLSRGVFWLSTIYSNIVPEQQLFVLRKNNSLIFFKLPIDLFCIPFDITFIQPPSGVDLFRLLLALQLIESSIKLYDSCERLLYINYDIVNSLLTRQSLNSYSDIYFMYWCWCINNEWVRASLHT
jgi:hypothetical protein